MYFDAVTNEDPILVKKKLLTREMAESWAATNELKPSWWSKHILLKFADDLYIEFKSHAEFREWDRTQQEIWHRKYGLAINTDKTVILTDSKEADYISVQGKEHLVVKWHLAHKHEVAFISDKYDEQKDAFTAQFQIK